MRVPRLPQVVANLPQYRREALIQRIAEDPASFRFSLLDPCLDTLLQIELCPLKALQARLQSRVFESCKPFHLLSSPCRVIVIAGRVNLRTGCDLTSPPVGP